MKSEDNVTNLAGFEAQVPHRAMRIACPNRVERASKSKFEVTIAAISLKIFKLHPQIAVPKGKRVKNDQNLNRFGSNRNFSFSAQIAVISGCNRMANPATPSQLRLPITNIEESGKKRQSTKIEEGERCDET